LGRGDAAGIRQRIRSVDLALTTPLVLPEDSRWARLVARGFAHSGDMPVWIVLLAAAWFLGDDAWKTRALVTAAGLALVEVVVIGIKVLIRRKRPAGTDGMIYRRTDPFSFPSGHAARAVLLSLLAARMGPAAAFISIVAWSPVMVVSRIAIGIHYVLDVAAGAAVGAVLTAIVLAAAAALGARF
jgi:membrane-associated phospholipid phosphatase